MSQHGVDHGAHLVCAVVRNGLVFEAPMGVQPGVPVAVMIAVAIGRVADDCVRALDKRQDGAHIPQIQRRIANGFDAHHIPLPSGKLRALTRGPTSASSKAVIASLTPHFAAYAPGRPFIFRAFATAIS